MRLNVKGYEVSLEDGMDKQVITVKLDDKVIVSKILDKNDLQGEYYLSHDLTYRNYLLSFSSAYSDQARDVAIIYAGNTNVYHCSRSPKNGDMEIKVYNKDERLLAEAVLYPDENGNLPRYIDSDVFNPFI